MIILMMHHDCYSLTSAQTSSLHGCPHLGSCACPNLLPQTAMSAALLQAVPVGPACSRLCILAHQALVCTKISSCIELPAARPQLTQHLGMQHPMHQTNSPAFHGQAVLVHKMLAGVGPSCRAIPWCRPR